MNTSRGTVGGIPGQEHRTAAQFLEFWAFCRGCWSRGGMETEPARHPKKGEHTRTHRPTLTMAQIQKILEVLCEP